MLIVTDRKGNVFPLIYWDRSSTVEFNQPIGEVVECCAHVMEAIARTGAQAVQDFIGGLDLIDMVGTIEMGLSREVFRARIVEMLQPPIERCYVGLRTRQPHFYAPEGVTHA